MLGRGRTINLAVGPESLVLLDNPYCDETVRIGVGGTSGTRFVFARCEEGDVGAREFEEMLGRKSAGKRKVVAVLGAVAACGGYGVARGVRVLGGLVCTLAITVIVGVVSASGGIERDDRGVVYRKEEGEESAAVS